MSSVPIAPELARRKARRLAAQLLAWYDEKGRVLPWRAKGSAATDPYRVWLSEIMLQQTTVAAVMPYFTAFLDRWPNVNALAAASLDEVLHAWQGLGYYARARNLHRCARLLAAQYRGRFPDTEAALRTLPGVGAYTAAAIAAIAFDEAATVVDGNVIRVIARLFGIAARRLRASRHGLGRHRMYAAFSRLPGLPVAAVLPGAGCRACTGAAAARSKAGSSHPARRGLLGRAAGRRGAPAAAAAVGSAWRDDGGAVDPVARDAVAARGGVQASALDRGVAAASRRRRPQVYALSLEGDGCAGPGRAAQSRRRRAVVRAIGLCRSCAAQLDEKDRPPRPGDGTAGLGHGLIDDAANEAKTETPARAHAPGAADCRIARQRIAAGVPRAYVTK